MTFIYYDKSEYLMYYKIAMVFWKWDTSDVHFMLCFAIDSSQIKKSVLLLLYKSKRINFVIRYIVYNTRQKVRIWVSIKLALFWIPVYIEASHRVNEILTVHTPT